MRPFGKSRQSGQFALPFSEEPYYAPILDYNNFALLFFLADSWIKFLRFCPRDVSGARKGARAGDCGRAQDQIYSRNEGRQTDICKWQPRILFQPVLKGAAAFL
jgi:hypothetical protein